MSERSVSSCCCVSLSVPDSTVSRVESVTTSTSTISRLTSALFALEPQPPFPQSVPGHASRWRHWVSRSWTASSSPGEDCLTMTRLTPCSPVCSASAATGGSTDRRTRSSTLLSLRLCPRREYLLSSEDCTHQHALDDRNGVRSNSISDSGFVAKMRSSVSQGSIST